MADEYINAQDLTEDISLDGEEQFVMFDSTMGKRAKLKNIKTYMNADVAKPDGDYPELTAGNADVSAVATALAGGSYSEESVPYKFRHTGGDITAGGAEEDCIVGGTIAWNQHMGKHTSYSFQRGGGVNVTVDSDGFVSISGTPSEDTVIVLYPSKSIPADRALLLLCDGYSGDFAWGRSGSQYIERDGYILKHNAEFTNAIRIWLDANRAYNVSGVRFATFDLTQMFGSSVADAVYAMEQGNAGTGVKWFKSLFPNDYYEYNAGELVSVGGLQSHDTVGFNAWDEEWEVGDFNTTTGANTSIPTQIRAKNYIPVIADTNYYVKADPYVWMMFFDSDKNVITDGLPNAGGTSANARRAGNQIVKMPVNCAYIRFYCQESYGTTYKNDICINLSWSGWRNGEYEAYQKHSYPLDSSLTLRGVPKLSEDNKMYYDGDEYRADGSVTRRYGVVDLGTLTWTHSGKYFKTSGLNNLIKRTPTDPSLPNLIASSIYHPTDWSVGSDFGIAVAPVSYTIENYVYVENSNYTDATAFKTAMSGVMLIYELATPTTETASAYVNPQACDEYGTEEYISTSVVPVGHKTKYYDNLTKRIDKLPSAIAPLEKSATSSANYSVGDYLILNNTLYKVTSAISAGGTITAGSNVTATTIMAEIKALQ